MLIAITINTVLVLLTYCGTAVQVVVRDREYANVPAGVRVNCLTNTISERAINGKLTTNHRNVTFNA